MFRKSCLKGHRMGGGFLFLQKKGGKSMTIDILGTAYDVAYIDKPPQGLDDCAGYIDPAA